MCSAALLVAFALQHHSACRFVQLCSAVQYDFAFALPKCLLCDCECLQKVLCNDETLFKCPGYRWQIPFYTALTLSAVSAVQNSICHAKHLNTSLQTLFAKLLVCRLHVACDLVAWLDFDPGACDLWTYNACDLIWTPPDLDPRACNSLVQRM